MRVLLIAAIFPPENAISAVRVESFVRSLAAAGHSVRVVTRVPPGEECPDIEHSDDEVVIGRTIDPLARFEKYVKPRVRSGEVRRGQQLRNSRLFSVAKRWALSALLFPDRFAPWAWRTRKELNKIEPKPDVVLVSAPPMSGVLLARAAARKFKCPYVVDYRDLLAFGPYHESGVLRQKLEQHAERLAVGRARALVTVSDPLADDLRRVHRKPVTVVMNGFNSHEVSLDSGISVSSGPLLLRYCGEVYRDKRDPAPLFEALTMLPKHVDVRVEFYGNSGGLIQDSVLAHGLEDQVAILPRVPRNESLRLQHQADLLLMLMWNSPNEVGVYSGKLFEYLSARRPILMLGYEQGVAAQLIRERRAGITSNDPATIARALTDWMRVKREGGIPALPPEVHAGLSREVQNERLVGLLADMVSQ